MIITHAEELLRFYRDYLCLVGDGTFVDISRRIDPARVSQPWESLERVSREFGVPRVIQIWTKNAGQVLGRGRRLLERLRQRGALVICQLTVTGFGPEFEPLVPWPVDWQGIDDLIDFLGGAKALLWRFDPVIPGLTDLRVLEDLAKRFAQRGIARAVYNWGEYGLELVRKRMGASYDRIDFSVEKNRLLTAIEAIGRDHGIHFMILAEGEKLSGELSLSSRGCWQYEWLVEVGAGFPPRAFQPGVFRSGCMCAPSFDVGLAGQYHDCHGCVYCFAE